MHSARQGSRAEGMMAEAEGFRRTKRKAGRKASAPDRIRTCDLRFRRSSAQINEIAELQGSSWAFKLNVMEIEMARIWEL